jgi:Family of unknown function (DUF5317)
VFILYVLPIGIVVGLLLGGRLAGLADLHFRWSGLMLAGLLVQVVLFSEPVAGRVGSLGPPLYIASTAVVLVAVLANRHIRGIPIVALGAACNLAAIIANGGYMPAAPAAAEVLDRTDPTIYSNSAVVDNPALGPLTDVFALPTWLPFTNIFSIGDLLIAVGVAVTVVVAMRAHGRPPVEPADRNPAAA